MEIRDLLNRDIVCECGRTHRCDISTVEIGQNALDTLPEATKGYRSILLVADQNTYPLCGERVRALLGERITSVCLYPQKSLLIPDERAAAVLESHLRPDTDLILGIGSGVINDLCKYAAFPRGIKNGIIATAPSMDGYASSGAAMILNGMKVTCTTQAPDIIIGDTAILKDAPLHMIRAGYGDIIGKYSSLCDWELAHLVCGEHFCPFLYDLVLNATNEIRDSVEGIVAREEQAIERLMRALVLIGMSLTFLGATRPGSGSEHHLSHFFEIVGLIHGEHHLPHGTDVAYNTILTAGMREQICALDTPVFCEESETERRAAWKRLFGNLYGEVDELQESAGSYKRDLRPIYTEKWEQIKAVLAKCPGAAECNKMMQAVGLNFAESESLYGTQKILDAMLYGKDLKDRYSVLWVYYALFSGARACADYRLFDWEGKK